MKQFLLILIANLLLSNFLFAQAPDKMSYQAIVRNSNNVVVSNHAVGMRISILKGTATGNAVYTETQTPTTNANGLIAIEIGTGTKINGNFTIIDWANGPYFVKTETDPNGGSNYTLTGTSQLLSVPYALHAKTASNGVPLGSQHGQMLTNCDGNLTWTFNGQCPAKIAVFNCADTVHTGIITSNFPVSNCSSSVSYSGGNGGIYSAQSIASIGVTGLTATLAAGTLSSGNGTLTLTISGTPTSAGIASFVLQIGNQTCVIMRSVVTASISNFNCADTIHLGTLFDTIAASSYYSTLSYMGGNGGMYAEQTIASTGVKGLTATLTAGTLNTGSGKLTLNITGKPTSAGIASFNITIGSKSCQLQRVVNVLPPQPNWSNGTVFCKGSPTLLIEVTNPFTGKTWMDRNLGASQAAISSLDTLALGDLYQWGRAADGHQCRNSGTTNSLSSTDQANHANFILALGNFPFDWRNPQNPNLWQVVNGINNPCPSGYRIPTNAELDAERTSWSQNNSTGAFGSPLKLPLAGYRSNYDGSLYSVGSHGCYWSSAVNGAGSDNLRFSSGYASMYDFYSRADGLSIRCIRDYPASIDTLGSINNGTLYEGIASNYTSTILNYTNGNGGIYAAQAIASTGVTGLIATLAAGTLNNGNGNLTLYISGTPTDSGIAIFNITIGNKSFQLQRAVNEQPIWPNSTVFCNSLPTLVIEVTNPITGKTWMDRNLGASQAATSSTDAAAYGDLYQWGRKADGHQCRNSATNSTLSSTDQPNHANFILADPIGSFDWRSTQNDNLWQGVNGTNNPCPSGYRIPSYSELDAERLSWSQNTSIGAFNSLLKLPMSGHRHSLNGSIVEWSKSGYWSRTVGGLSSALNLFFFEGNALLYNDNRASGFPVRCIKDYSASFSSMDTIGLINNGFLYEGIASSNTSTTLNYTNGNGAFYDSQTIPSTGVTGLTATLAAGTLNSGNGTLTLNISGTPNTAGIASFNITIGSKSCIVQRTVNTLLHGTFRLGTIHCNGTPTAVVDIINPITGKTWMDRNLGAIQAATSSVDALAYGDLYQWGRAADGHQCRNSATTSTVSSTDQPNHANFILADPLGVFDWRSTQNNNLWQGVNGINNPCPFGYRIPSIAELDAERTSWTQYNNTGAFNSPLKLPMSGQRYNSNFSYVGSYGYYWGSSDNSQYSGLLGFYNLTAYVGSYSRANGCSVRCIKD
jgi:uncharacterized protein (TIGR02145 family)